MAANTDLFKDLSRRWVGQIGAGGVADASVTTIPLSSATNLSTDTAVVVVIDRVDANGTATPNLEETVIGVVSGSNLVNCVRGAEGTAQAHDAGKVVEVLFTAKGWNDLIDGLLVQHDQLGRHTNITASNITASGTQTLCHVSASDVTARTASLCEVTFSNGDPNIAPAAGNIKVGGSDPKRGIYIDATAMKSRTSNGAASSSSETTTNKVMKSGYAFDKDADEFVQFKIPAPKYWDLGTITATPYWTADAGTSGTVCFAVQVLALSNDDAIDTAFGTEQTSTDTFLATGDQHIGPVTNAITVGNSPAKGDELVFQVYRDVSADTFDADAILIGLHVQFTIGQYDDQ